MTRKATTLPQMQQLSDDLRKLARLNALQMSYERYQYDESRLMAITQNVLGSEPS